MRRQDGRLLRTWKAGHKAKLNGYLEDYAYLADGPGHDGPSQEIPHIPERSLRAGLEDRADLRVRDPMHVLERQPDPVALPRR